MAASEVTTGLPEGLLVRTFGDDGVFPNSALPLLVYRGALADPSPDAFEALFAGRGWPPAWRSSVFTYHHYHSTAHETLGIACGSGRLMLGGPRGEVFEVEAGDVVVIPAGVAHRRLSSSPDFSVVGCYPPGQTWDLLRGESGERPMADRNIARVALPRTDPVGGEGGPLVKLWTTRQP